MKKPRAKLAAIGLVLIAAVASYWLWLAPGGPPGCNGIDACTSSAPLELSALDFDVDSIQPREIALSPDGGTVVVLAQAKRDTVPFDAAIASFDVATGAHSRTYLSEKVFGLRQVAFSPDGSVLAVSYYGPETTKNEDVQLFDVATGDVLHTDLVPCSFSLGLSADNALLQCEANVFDIATGERIENADRLAIQSFPSDLIAPPGAISVSRNELTLHGDRTRETAYIEFNATNTRLGVDVQLQGTLDLGRVLYLARSESHSIWKPLPQRIGGWLVVFDAAGGEHAGNYELDATPVGVAISEDGSDAVVIDADFTVQSFDVDQIVAQT